MDVEVGSDDDALVSQYDIVNRLLTQFHGDSVRSVLPGMGVSVRQNQAEAGIASRRSMPCCSCRDYLDQVSNPA